MCCHWSAESVARLSRTFNGWKTATISSLEINTSSTSCPMERASWSSPSRIKKRILARTLAKPSAMAAATALVTTCNSRDQLRTNSTVFIGIIIAIHWSPTSRPVSQTTPSHRVAASHCSLKLLRTAKPNGSATAGSSITSRQSATSSTTATASSRASSML